MISGCTDEKSAKNVLLNEGYRNIKFTGYDFLSCSDDEIYHTGFRAYSNKNRLVTGTVCGGIFKGSTIRY